MNPILCLLTTLTVVLSSSFLLVVQNANQTAAGEIVEVGCKKSWRKDENGKEDLLDPKRDKGRTVFIGESYRCEGKGILKLVVHSRGVDLKEENGWHPIGTTGGPNKPNTAGPEGEELGWLHGVFWLNPAESDNSGKGGEKFLASLTPEQRSKFNNILGTQLTSPIVFAVSPHNETFGVVFPLDQKFSFKADGVMREQQLPDGTEFKIKAQADGEILFIRSVGKTFTADTKVEPKDEGQKLAITRTIHLIGYDKPVTWTAVYDRNPPEQSFISHWYGLKGESPLSFLVETVTSELQESISTDVLTESKFSLKVTAPDYLAGAIITGRIFKTPHNRPTGAFWLDVYFDYIRLPSGATSVFRGDVKQILSPGGGTVAKESDLMKRRITREGPRLAQGAGPSIEPQATYSLGGPLVLEKGAKIVIDLRSVP